MGERIGRVGSQRCKLLPEFVSRNEAGDLSMDRRMTRLRGGQARAGRGYQEEAFFFVIWIQWGGVGNVQWLDMKANRILGAQGWTMSLPLTGWMVLAAGCAHPQPQAAYVPVYHTGPPYVVQQPGAPPPQLAGMVPAPPTGYWQSPPPPAPAPPPVQSAPPVQLAPPPQVVVVAPSAPPPPIVEARPIAPAPYYVWVPGHWGWANRWVWVSGQWVARPRPSAVWVGGRWAKQGGGWVWIGGGWR